MFDLGNRPARVFTPLAAVVLGVTVLIPACSQAPPFQPKSTVGQLMHDVVYPRAHEVWKSVGTIVTEEGTEEIRPRTDIEWEVVHSGARTLMEAGNLLMMAGRAKDNDKWMEHCQELIEGRGGGARIVRSLRRRCGFRSRGIDLQRLPRLPLGIPLRGRSEHHPHSLSRPSSNALPQARIAGAAGGAVEQPRDANCAGKTRRVEAFIAEPSYPVALGVGPGSRG